MAPFTTVQSRAIRLPAPNIDTDQIVPARFLRNPRSAGYAGFLFHDLRFDPAGQAIPAFALNQPELRDARILLAGANFGCGSSREGAVYALADWGIRCVIAPSFGDIFRNNCYKNGVLPVALAEPEIAALAATDGPLTVDLAAQTVSAGNRVAALRHRAVLEGLPALRPRRHRPDPAAPRRNRGLRGRSSRAAALAAAVIALMRAARCRPRAGAARPHLCHVKPACPGRATSRVHPAT